MMYKCWGLVLLRSVRIPSGGSMVLWAETQVQLCLLDLGVLCLKKEMVTDRWLERLTLGLTFLWLSSGWKAGVNVGSPESGVWNSVLQFSSFFFYEVPKCWLHLILALSWTILGFDQVVPTEREQQSGIKDGQNWCLSTRAAGSTTGGRNQEQSGNRQPPRPLITGRKYKKHIQIHKNTEKHRPWQYVYCPDHLSSVNCGGKCVFRLWNRLRLCGRIHSSLSS